MVLSQSKIYLLEPLFTEMEENMWAKDYPIHGVGTKYYNVTAQSDENGQI